MLYRPELGQIVDSTAGRDAGKRYMIIRILDTRFVEVIDGRGRTWENPKKKSIRHLKLVSRPEESVVETIRGGTVLKNSQVRSLLERPKDAVNNKGDE